MFVDILQYGSKYIPSVYVCREACSHQVAAVRQRWTCIGNSLAQGLLLSAVSSKWDCRWTSQRTVTPNWPMWVTFYS